MACSKIAVIRSLDTPLDLRHSSIAFMLIPVSSIALAPSDTSNSSGVSGEAGCCVMEGTRTGRSRTQADAALGLGYYRLPRRGTEHSKISLSCGNARWQIAVGGARGDAVEFRESRRDGTRAGETDMICRIFILLAESGPTALQLALAGVGCALVVEALNRWRRKGRTAIEMGAQLSARFENSQEAPSKRAA